MSNNEQREGLAYEITGHHVGDGYYSAIINMDEAREIADAILAAGYSKPRTITTAKELDALPEGSVVLDGDVCVRRADGYWKLLDLIGVYASASITLPATVIHEPTTEATP